MTPDSTQHRQKFSVSLNGVSKSFPGVKALDGISLTIKPGTVHALVGENGAGKSTLIKILSGDISPDEGTIEINDAPVRFRTPRDAQSHGIATIFQELMIVPEMSVAENVMLGNTSCSMGHGVFFSRSRCIQLASAVLDELHCLHLIDPTTRAGDLSTGQKQIIEIARALARDAPIIIFDEPTASLSSAEADSLLALIAKLKANGATILYVSHRLEELLGIADEVTILRNGRHISTLPAAAVEGVGDLIRLMVGGELRAVFPPRSENTGDVVLSVEKLSRRGVFDNVSFNVSAGEVLGFAGLVGAGRTEIMRCVFGADQADAGHVVLGGRSAKIRRPADAIRSGMGYVPEDRKDLGLVLGLSGRANLILGALKEYATWGLVSASKSGNAVQRMGRRLRFKGQLAQPARTYSGGNQQKLVLGKSLLTKPSVLILDEPTRGIDIGAKAEIYHLIHELASEGVAIIVVSSEIGELTNLCHRILTVSGGRITDEFIGPEFDGHAILSSAFSAHLSARAPVAASSEACAM